MGAATAAVAAPVPVEARHPRPNGAARAGVPLELKHQTFEGYGTSWGRGSAHGLRARVLAVVGARRRLPPVLAPTRVGRRAGGP